MIMRGGNAHTYFEDTYNVTWLLMKPHGRVKRGRGISHFARQLAERTHARSAESPPAICLSPELKELLVILFYFLRYL